MASALAALSGTKAEKIAALRSGIAALSGSAAPSWTNAAEVDYSPDALDVPATLEALLGGVIRRGAVTTIDHAGALLSAIVAHVSVQSRVAVVGVADLGLISIAEQGGNLEHILWVPDAGTTPLEVIGLLAEGVDLVVAGLPLAPAPTLSRPVQARLRRYSTAMVFVGENWPNSEAQVSTTLSQVEGLCSGHGRITAVEYAVQVKGGRFPQRHGSFTVGTSCRRSAASIRGAAGAEAGNVAGNVAQEASSGSNVVALSGLRRAQ